MHLFSYAFSSAFIKFSLFVKIAILEVDLTKSGQLRLWSLALWVILEVLRTAAVGRACRPGWQWFWHCELCFSCFSWFFCFSSCTSWCSQNNFEASFNFSLFYKLGEDNYFLPNPPGNSVFVLSLHKHILQSAFLHPFVSEFHDSYCCMSGLLRSIIISMIQVFPLLRSE